jgi:hypothetical protein
MPLSAHLVNLVALDFASWRKGEASVSSLVAKVSTAILARVQLEGAGENALLEHDFVDGRVHWPHCQSSEYGQLGCLLLKLYVLQPESRLPLVVTWRPSFIQTVSSQAWVLAARSESMMAEVVSFMVVVAG